MFKGIDVSVHNGTIDWAKVKKSGVEFAIIRSGYGWDRPNQVDKYLKTNVEGCEANDIPYGFYHYSYATTPDEARQEADWFISVIEKYQPTYPLVFDWEESSIVNSTNSSTATAIADAFLSRLEEKGYYGMLYGSSSKINQLFNNNTMKKYDIWVAHWGVNEPSVKLPYGIWQYSSTGKVDGIDTVVDMNYAYKDYPSIIKSAGLNHLQKDEENEVVKPSEETVSKKDYDALSDKYDALISALEDIIKEYKRK